MKSVKLYRPGRAEWILSCALLLSDLLAVVISYTLSFQIRRWLPLLPPLAHGADVYLNSWPLLFIWPLSFLFFRLYPGWWYTASEELRLITISSTFAGLLTISETFITHTGIQYSRPIVIGGWLLSLVLLPLMRIPLKRWLSRLGLHGPSAIVLGARNTAEVFLDGIRRLKPPPFTPLALFDDDPHKLGKDIGGVPVVGKLNEAPVWGREHGVRNAIIAMPGLERANLMGIIETLSESFPRIIIVPNLFGMTSIGVIPRQAQGIIGLELDQRLLSRTNKFLKRSLDLVAILIIFPFMLLPALLISIAILLESGRPLFFVHERIGLRGNPFRAWKFRTMVNTADETFKAAMDGDAGIREEWESTGKLRQDPRLTTIGRFLRRFSLDELPQFWNLVKGDMSLVGPRPIIRDEISKYGDAYALYRQVRPGLTGLWQVSGRSTLPYEDRVWLDSHYVRNWSIWLDIVILLRTVGAVFSGRGAY